MRQLQEKYSAKKKDLHFLFVDLERAFDLALMDEAWWALKELVWKDGQVCTVDVQECSESS